MDTILGIDLGTTNSVFSIIRDRDVQVLEEGRSSPRRRWTANRAFGCWFGFGRQAAGRLSRPKPMDPGPRPDGPLDQTQDGFRGNGSARRSSLFAAGNLGDDPA